MSDDYRRSIQLRIGGRLIPLNIKPEQEEILRKAADDVDKRLEVYKARGSKSDIVELLSLIAVEFASNLYLSKQEQDDSLILAELEQINDKLESMLSEK